MGARRDRLGEVVVPSGALVVTDPGLLPFWCGEGQPRQPEGEGPEVDLRVVGREAAAAGRAFGRQWHPLYLYDEPDPETTREQFAEWAAERGLDARLVVLAERVSHRRRVDLAILQGGGAGEVQYNRLWAAAVGGLPPGRALEVVAVSLDDDPDGGWRYLDLEVAPERPVVRREDVGLVMVEHGRVVLACADALSAWSDAHAAQLEAEAQGTPEGAAVLALGAARVCAATGWEDGLHGVVRELDADGALVRVRVDAGHARRGLRRGQLRGQLAVVSNRVLREGRRASYLVREHHLRDGDSGWTVYAGDEPAGYGDDPTNFAVVRIGELLDRDGSLAWVLDAPPGSAFRRVGDSDAFRAVVGRKARGAR